MSLPFTVNIALMTFVHVVDNIDVNEIVVSGGAGGRIDGGAMVDTGGGYAVFQQHRNMSTVV